MSKFCRCQPRTGSSSATWINRLNRQTHDHVVDLSSRRPVGESAFVCSRAECTMCRRPAPFPANMPEATHVRARPLQASSIGMSLQKTFAVYETNPTSLIPKTLAWLPFDPDADPCILHGDWQSSIFARLSRGRQAKSNIAWALLATYNNLFDAFCYRLHADAGKPTA